MIFRACGWELSILSRRSEHPLTAIQKRILSADLCLFILLWFEEAYFKFVFFLPHQDLPSAVGAGQKEVRLPNEFRNQIICAFFRMVLIKEFFRSNQRYTRVTK
jgi:hypothetical protein